VYVQTPTTEKQLRNSAASVAFHLRSYAVHLVRIH